MSASEQFTLPGPYQPTWSERRSFASVFARDPYDTMGLIARSVKTAVNL